MTTANVLLTDWDPDWPYVGDDGTLMALEQLEKNMNAGAANLFDGVDCQALTDFQVSPASPHWHKGTPEMARRQLAYLSICRAVQAVMLLCRIDQPLFHAPLCAWLLKKRVACESVAGTDPPLYKCSHESATVLLEELETERKAFWAPASAVLSTLAVLSHFEDTDYAFQAFLTDRRGSQYGIRDERHLWRPSGQFAVPSHSAYDKFYGRDAELQSLLRSWFISWMLRTRFRDRPFAACLKQYLPCIVGQPGTGKSRIADQLCELSGTARGRNLLFQQFRKSLGDGYDKLATGQPLRFADVCQGFCAPDQLAVDANDVREFERLLARSVVLPVSFNSPQPAYHDGHSVRIETRVASRMLHRYYAASKEAPFQPWSTCPFSLEFVCMQICRDFVAAQQDALQRGFDRRELVSDPNLVLFVDETEAFRSAGFMSRRHLFEFLGLTCQLIAPTITALDEVSVGNELSGAKIHTFATPIRLLSPDAMFKVVLAVMDGKQKSSETHRGATDELPDDRVRVGQLDDSWLSQVVAIGNGHARLTICLLGAGEGFTGKRLFEAAKNLAGELCPNIATNLERVDELLSAQLCGRGLLVSPQDVSYGTALFAGYFVPQVSPVAILQLAATKRSGIALFLRNAVDYLSNDWSNFEWLSASLLGCRLFAQHCAGARSQQLDALFGPSAQHGTYLVSQSLSLTEVIPTVQQLEHWWPAPSSGAATAEPVQVPFLGVCARDNPGADSVLVVKDISHSPRLMVFNFQNKHADNLADGASLSKTDIDHSIRQCHQQNGFRIDDAILRDLSSWQSPYWNDESDCLPDLRRRDLVVVILAWRPVARSVTSATLPPNTVVLDVKAMIGNSDSFLSNAFHTLMLCVTGAYTLDKEVIRSANSRELRHWLKCAGVPSAQSAAVTQLRQKVCRAFHGAPASPREDFVAPRRQPKRSNQQMDDDSKTHAAAAPRPAAAAALATQSDGEAITPFAIPRHGVAARRCSVCKQTGHCKRTCPDSRPS